MDKCKMQRTAEESSHRRMEGLLRVDRLCANCGAYKVPGPCKKCGAKKN
jgi:hypothetical protein